MAVRADLRHGFGICARLTSIPDMFLDGLSKMLFGAGSYQPEFEVAKVERDGRPNFIKCAAGVTIKSLIDSNTDVILDYDILLVDFLPTMIVWQFDTVTVKKEQTDPYKMSANVCQQTLDT